MSNKFLFVFNNNGLYFWFSKGKIFLFVQKYLSFFGARFLWNTRYIKSIQSSEDFFFFRINKFSKHYLPTHQENNPELIKCNQQRTWTTILISTRISKFSSGNFRWCFCPIYTFRALVRKMTSWPTYDFMICVGDIPIPGFAAHAQGAIISVKNLTQFVRFVSWGTCL